MDAPKDVPKSESNGKSLESLVTETGSAPDCAVIWLHGLGADGHDFAPIVPQLRSGQMRPIRFIFPHAPVRPVTVNAGMKMRAWYDIAGFDMRSRDHDAAGIGQSLTQVDALIDAQAERGIAPDRVLLAGFSQGGAIALRAGLAQRRRLAGIIGLSGYLLQSDNLDDWLTEAGRSTPVFMGHGTADPVVPVELGRRSAERLTQAGIGLEWHEWNMQHGVCPEELLMVDRWIDARLGQADKND